MCASRWQTTPPCGGTNADSARQFAAVTFLSDNRADLPKVKTPSLILQCQQDTIAQLVDYTIPRLDAQKAELMLRVPRKHVWNSLLDLAGGFSAEAVSAIERDDRVMAEVQLEHVRLLAALEAELGVHQVQVLAQDGSVVADPNYRT